MHGDQAILIPRLSWCFVCTFVTCRLCLCTTLTVFCRCTVSSHVAAGSFVSTHTYMSTCTPLSVVFCRFFDTCACRR